MEISSTLAASPMGLYRDHLFPRLMDRAMRGVNELRAATLACAQGDVLEVGFGTGLNLRYYPAAVRSLVALDPLRALRSRVERRVANAPFPVKEETLAAGGRLPFVAGRFDCVVTSWTLCSIDAPGPALAEMRRVLRPEGLYLFIEHGLALDPCVARWQRRLDPLHTRIAGGCHLDRPIDRLVRDAGFAFETLERFVYERGPFVARDMFRGVARPTA